MCVCVCVQSTLTFWYHSVYAVSSSIVYVGASDGKIYRSFDGGNSWAVDYGRLG